MGRKPTSGRIIGVGLMDGEHSRARIARNGLKMDIHADVDQFLNQTQNVAVRHFLDEIQSQQEELALHQWILQERHEYADVDIYACNSCRCHVMVQMYWVPPDECIDPCPGKRVE